MRRVPAFSAFSAFIAALALIAAIGPGPVRAQGAVAEGVWTVTIPTAFPRNVYTWRVAPDGTYSEDGRDARNGSRLQGSSTGKWSLQGIHLVLRQDGDQGFVFDGIVSAGCYIGRLSFEGRDISSFTARKRGSNVRRCDGGNT